MIVSDLSILTGLVGYDETYSLSEFKEYLEVDLPSKKCKHGWVFWRPERCQQLEYELPADEEIDNVTPFDLLIPSEFCGRETKATIKRLLETMTSSDEICRNNYLVQFWAPEMVDQHLYLTTSDQPFALRPLHKGFCWYRKDCMGHRYRIDEEAEEELGPVGRAYKNKQPESSPDLRLYSTEEFPLRDVAARYGLREYIALPVFDLCEKKCYGVIEVLTFYGVIIDGLGFALEASQLRTTHLNFGDDLYLKGADDEIIKMLEIAIRVMPQLQMAQVWAPCGECPNASSNLGCMKRVAYINAGEKSANSRNFLDHAIWAYDYACSFLTLKIGKCTNMIDAVMSSNNKPCFCRNICDFSISENPFAHYAQKARLSFCFAISLQRSSNSRDIYLVEFFLQFNSGKDAFADESSLPLLLRIMEMELKHFKFGERGEHGEELVVEVCKENMLSSGESSQEYIKYKLKLPREISMLMDMQGCKEICPLSGFLECLQKADLHCLRPSERRTHGWTFWSWASKELPESSNWIHEKIKCLMSETTFKLDKDSYALAQFWAPKMDMDRLYLETSGQPFAVGNLHKGLAFFRKLCMENYYFVDERAKEEELGPLGRVFLNKHPEITPDLRLYSPTEFPLRNHAAHYGLREYFALPVFDLNQHKCVGVLELVGYSDWTLEVIQHALEAANLSSTHIYFKPRFQDAKCRQLALTEIQEARELFDRIPQLYMVGVWVPYSKCPSPNNNFCCMERVWAMPNYQRELDHTMYQIQHVKTREGIAGMALASENKSCFCRNLCGFSIAEQPLAHYAQHVGLDVCFAICLQSWHTGDLLYILEFYLNQGPRQLEYLRSFLCLLLTVMKQKLKSFKVASGQELGEKLVVEVIEFSEVDKFAISELDQPDIFPVTFKFVKYGGQKLSKDKLVLFAPDGMESVRSVAVATRTF